MTSLIVASPEKFTHGFRRSFCITDKVKVLETLLESTHNNLSRVAREHNINRSTLLRWMRNREDILKAAEKSSSSRRVSGGGRPCLLDKPVVTRLLQFVAKRWAAFQPVTARMLYYEWVKVNPDAAQLSESAAKARIYRFMRRNDLVVRRTTHHAQVSRSNPKIIDDWISYMQNLCKTYGIEKECIANFDETDNRRLWGRCPHTRT
eukprot:scaffold12477_cov89-Amphora_coffeaeformis.AAC.1